MAFQQSKLVNMAMPPQQQAPEAAPAPMEESPAEESAEHKELVALTQQMATFGQQLQKIVSMVEELSAKMAQDEAEDKAETDVPEGPEAEPMASAPAPAPTPAPRTSAGPMGGSGPMPGAPRIALPGGQ